MHREKEILKYGGLLKSQVALKVLMLADGSLTSSELAKKLNKHASNVSAIISRLKKEGLVEADEKGRLKRTINRLNINFR